MSWICYLLACWWLISALLTRRRMAVLHPLECSSEVASDDHLFLTAPGVNLDDAGKRAASAFARRRNLDFLDLLPERIPALDALGFLQLMKPADKEEDPLQVSFPAGYAVLISKNVWDKSALEAPPASLPEFLAAAKSFSRCAGANRATGVVRGWAPKRPEVTSWEALVALLGSGLIFVLWLQAIQFVLILSGLLLSPPGGLVALLSYHLQVPITLVSGRLRASELMKSTIFRSFLECWRLATVLWSRPNPTARMREVESKRSYYRDLQAQGVSTFFEPRRDQCPLCQAQELESRLTTTDLFQGKPGRFSLERCRRCGLVFQNPRLSKGGLEYYYGDFYDGLGREDLDMIFSSGGDSYQQRADMIQEIHRPERWLDVGAGHGHFCSVARQTWPQTRFDGLDMSNSVLDGVRYGWLDDSIQAMFPETASSLAGRYDVVSMFHYLEHTIDPRAELAASYEVLGPGGVLLIEVPNPECSVAKWLGRFWICWFQPQHLHIISLSGMKELLVESGFEPVKWEVEGAHIAAEFIMAVNMLRTWTGGWGHVPWRPKPTPFERLRYWLFTIPWVPGLAAAFALDQVAAWLFPRVGVSNAYRVVARRKTRGDF